MRKIPAALVLTALAAAVPAALAQQVTGSVSLGGIATDVDERNPWRLHEYRDLDDGVIAGFRLRADYGSWYHNLFGENLGRDDQFLEARGGRYGLFKYRLYADDVIHNWTFNAITPFSGVGSSNLVFTGTAPSTDVSTWNPFDYTQQHKNVGGFAEVTPGVDSPLYFRVTGNRKKTEGIRPLGQAGGSPGGPVYELPMPLDRTTSDISGEAGYSSKTMHLSASVLYSKFEDNNDALPIAEGHQHKGGNSKGHKKARLQSCPRTVFLGVATETAVAGKTQDPKQRHRCRQEENPLVRVNRNTVKQPEVVFPACIGEVRNHPRLEQ